MEMTENDNIMFNRMLKDNLNDFEVEQKSIEYITLIPDPHLVLFISTPLSDKHALNYANFTCQTLKIKTKVEISALPLAAVL